MYQFDMKNCSYSLIYIEGNRGSGKTLLLVALMKEYSKFFPKNKIFANFHINLPNFEYIPDCYLPHDSLTNCFIAFDDCKVLKGLDELLLTISNESRKTNLIVVLTGQFYTDFKPQIRDNAEYKVICKIYCTNCFHNDFDRKTQCCKKCGQKGFDKLEFTMIDRIDNNYSFQIINPILQLSRYFNTDEIVKRPTQRNIIDVIKRNSKTLDDLETNISIFTKSQSKRNKLFKDLSIELGLLDKNTNFTKILI